MAFASNQHHDRGDDRRDEERQVDLDVGEEDKPLVSRAFLELSGRFCAANAACGIFSTNACKGQYYNYESRSLQILTNTQKEAVRHKRSQQARWTSSSAIRARSKRCEENDDNGRCEQRPLPREVIGSISEKKHTKNRASEGDAGNIRLRRRFGIGVRIYLLEHGVDRTDNLCLLSV
jgi:hypothetical protein